MDKNNFSNIRIVLVGTTHPGNIGAAARAMKTMGLSRLYLVTPRQFPCAEATSRASGADDVLQKAQVCETLPEALQGCAFAIATTARLRAIPWPVMLPREMAVNVYEQAATNEVAIVFGREHAGLTNEELAFCQAAVKVPTVDDYSSLNLAAAVQLIAYELRLAELGQVSSESVEKNAYLATADQVERFYAHLEQTMIDLDFYDPDNPRLLMLRVRRLFNRAHLEESEVQILRGLLTAAQKAKNKSTEQYDIIRPLITNQKD